ncbi:hypothetical protein [Methanococcoides sp. NM1]|uniref:hypothetical protein n=1 Tax=Methanococcoides sp. NM1 TaxID=1201013 RepID=UPI001083DCE7|nr:hypothetical protein [Methanococcoides sp. NM1]
MKTKMRFGLTVLLTAMLLVSMAVLPAVSAQANENIGTNTENYEYSIEKEYGQLFLEKMGYSAKLTSPVPLKNMEDDVEAVAFSVNNEGYIIINVNDLSVPEFSMTSGSPFVDESKDYYYNGPLAYVEAEKLKDKKMKTAYIYKKEKVDKSKKLSDLKKTAIETPNIQLLSSTSGSLLHTLETWEDDNIYCGPIAAGITLIYLDDYCNPNFVDPGYENQQDLLNLITTDYISNSPDGVSPYGIRDGLNSYIADQNLDNSYSSYGTLFNYNKLVSLINDNKPVIVCTLNHPTFITHATIAHGYYVLDVPYVNPQLYIVVNNGWGDNNISILVDDYLNKQVWIE